MKQQSRINIKEVLKIHDTLCDAVHMIRSFYNIQMICLIFNMVFFNLLCGFEISHNLNSETSDKVFSIYDFLWILFDFYFMISIFVAISLLDKELFATTTIFNKIENGNLGRKRILAVSNNKIWQFKNIRLINF